MSEADKKTVLVTGGAGFIGSHLCGELLRRGQRVICLDNFFTGSRDNLRAWDKHPDFTVLEHDIELAFNYPVDRIYNLACPAAPVWYQKDPVKTIRTCVSGAINVLDLAQRYGARVLQASTSEVYGDPNIHPQTEGYWGNVNPLGPRSCYDEGKRCAESLFMSYHREKGTDIRLVRIFNTYGPHMALEDGRVVSNFIIQALRHQDITIYGDGAQTRSFCYVDDLVRGLIAMMEQDGFAGPVNLGNPSEFTIKELAEAVLEQLPESRSRIIYQELPQDDPRQRQPDIGLARTKLGWQPELPLAEGLKPTIAYFRGLAL